MSFQDENNIITSPELCGLLNDSKELNIRTMINLVFTHNHQLRLAGDAMISFRSFYDEFLKNTIDGYNDGYTKDMCKRAELMLTGAYFELVVNKFANINSKQLEKVSNDTFSIEKKYDNKPDFLYLYSSRKEKPGLEVKNFYSMESFISARLHNALYVLINNRSENKLLLLSRPKHDEKLDASYTLFTNQVSNSKGDTYEVTYKQINLWPFLWPIQKSYNTYGLGNSWHIIDNRDYIDIYDPCK